MEVGEGGICVVNVRTQVRVGSPSFFGAPIYAAIWTPVLAVSVNWFRSKRFPTLFRPLHTAVDADWAVERHSYYDWVIPFGKQVIDT